MSHSPDRRYPRAPSRLLSIPLALAALPGVALAGEGMWMPEQLPAIEGELKAAGLTMAAKDLADLGSGPLAAVINLNGCTASFVSPDGLVVTNHHCAVGAIQRNTTPKENRYETGYTAKTRQDELWAGPSARVRVTLSQEDVTSQFAGAVGKAGDDAAVFRATDALEKALVAACEKDKRLRCRVARYDGGARWVLVRQLDIKDVRLVHFPPRAIGVYGGDEDNWMWPRHTGDWSMFRAYVAPDGAPAEHDAKNVPYRPKRWLTVSTEGVQPGSFVAVAGYPARTYRYRTAAELRHAAETGVPATIRLLEALLGVVEQEQKRSPDARVKLTSTHAWIANYLKYSKGLLDGFQRSGVAAEREAQERALLAWVDADPARKQRLRPGMDALAAAVAARTATERRDRTLGWLVWLPTMLRTAATLHWLAAQQDKPDAQREAGYQERDHAELRAGMAHRFRQYLPAADAALTRLMLLDAESLPKTARIAGLDRFMARFRRAGEPASKSVDRAVTWLYQGGELQKEAVRKRLFGAKRTVVEASKDRFIQLAAALYGDRVEARKREEAHDGAMARLRPTYMAALREQSKGAIYSDANATLRVTFGQVAGYSPREAITYTPLTTLRGVLEKDRGKEPFDVPAAQRAAADRLHARQRPGAPTEPWVSGGTVGVNFLSTCDTTGGNSGSPTLDAQGRLIGLLFDGNYEAMSSDWVFDRKRTRSIHVDIRYLLWSLFDLFDGKHLLREMGVLPQ